MLTFFTTAKPFRGHDGIIQRNALKSWKLLHPDIEVVLFGDDEGAAEVCADLGLRHEAYVERDGKVPYVNFMFARAQKIARHDYLCYSNCDIIFFSDLLKAFERALLWRRRFLLVAQRWDTDIAGELNFANSDWATELRRFARAQGFLQDSSFVDFFLFPRGLYDVIPPLVVGYCFWDHWMVWRALSSRAPVLDVSSVILALHQNHGYAPETQRVKGSVADPRSLQNFELTQSGKQTRAIQHSTHQLTREGRVRSRRFRLLLEATHLYRVRQAVVEASFGLRSRLGLRRQTIDKLRGVRPPSLD